jgi:hypothetical protein
VFRFSGFFELVNIPSMQLHVATPPHFSYENTASSTDQLLRSPALSFPFRLLLPE